MMPPPTITICWSDDMVLASRDVRRSDEWSRARLVRVSEEIGLTAGTPSKGRSIASDDVGDGPAWAGPAIRREVEALMSPEELRAHQC